MRYDIRLSGSGGQGIIVMGILLAEAIGVYGGKYVAQTQSYGPQARGGSSKVEIVVSDEEIDYPEAMKLDLLLAMNQVSCDEYYTDLKPEGLLIADSTFVTQLPVPRAFAIPFTKIAREKLNAEAAANLVAIGALPVLTGIVSPQALEKAIRKRLPRDTEEFNLKALRAGMAAARKAARKTAGPSRRIAWEDEDL